MKKLFKKAPSLLAVLLLAAAAYYSWRRYVVSANAEVCFGKTGRPAVQACTSLARWQTGRDKAEALYRRSRLYAAGASLDQEQRDLETIEAMSAFSELPGERRSLVYVGLALTHTRKGDPARAAKYLELAVQAGSRDQGAFLGLADFYMEQKEFGQAVAVLASAPIAEDQKGHPYYNSLAAAYVGAGDYRSAYTALKAALAIKAPRPVMATTAKQMGIVCFELQRYKEAERCLSYVSRSGIECMECPLLITAIRESLGVY